MMPNWKAIAQYKDISELSPITTTVEGINIVVFLVEGNLYAIEDRCPHMDFPLSDGLIDGTEIMCIHHGARFCLKSGKVLAPPAFENVDTFPVEVVDGEIRVDIDI